MFGKAQQMNVCLAILRFEIGAPGPQEAFEGTPRLLGAEIARHRGFEFVGCHRAAPETERLPHGCALGANKKIGLQSLDGRHGARQREADEGDDVCRQAEQDAVDQRWQMCTKKARWPKPCDAHGPVADERSHEWNRAVEGGDQQRIGPDDDPSDETRDGATCIRPVPDQAAEKGRRNLRHGCKG